MMIKTTAHEQAELKRYFPSLAHEKQQPERQRSVADRELSPRVSFRNRLKQEIATDRQKERLYQATVDFQALFIKQMLNSMRSSLRPEEGLLYGGFRQKIFEDMLFDHYSGLLSQDEGFYLAEQLYRQLSPVVGETKNISKTISQGIPESISKTILEDKKNRAAQLYQQNGLPGRGSP